MELIFEAFVYIIFEFLFHLGFDRFENKKNYQLRNNILNSLVSKPFEKFIFNNSEEDSQKESDSKFSIFSSKQLRFEIIVELNRIIIFPFYSNNEKYEYRMPYIISNEKLKYPFKSCHCNFAKPIHFRIRKSMKGRADLFLVRDGNTENKEELCFMNLTDKEKSQLTAIFENSFLSKS